MYAKILAVCGLVLVSAAGNILVILAVARHRAMRWVPTLQVYILAISPVHIQYSAHLVIDRAIIYKEYKIRPGYPFFVGFEPRKVHCILGLTQKFVNLIVLESEILLWFDLQRQQYEIVGFRF